MQEGAQPVAEERTNEQAARGRGPPADDRRRAVGAGVVITVVLVVAGGLLTWGSNFANDYVGDELTSQHIYFPDRPASRRRAATT